MKLLPLQTCFDRHWCDDAFMLILCISLFEHIVVYSKTFSNASFWISCALSTDGQTTPTQCVLSCKGTDPCSDSNADALLNECSGLWLQQRRADWLFFTKEQKMMPYVVSELNKTCLSTRSEIFCYARPNLCLPWPMNIRFSVSSEHLLDCGHGMVRCPSCCCFLIYSQYVNDETFNQTLSCPNVSLNILKSHDADKKHLSLLIIETFPNPHAPLILSWWLPIGCA